MSTLTFDYIKESKLIKELLRQNFQENTVVETHEGSGGRVQVVIVSDQFNDKSETEKQDLIWDILKDLIPEPDLQAVSLAVVYGTDEL